MNKTRGYLALTLLKINGGKESGEEDSASGNFQGSRFGRK